MRVLIIKTSSLGDIIHTFPALSDAARAIPDIKFDWVVEESYAQIPGWHPAVDQVIPSAIRRWRKSWMKTWLHGEWRGFVRQLQQRDYDAVIDAQGLLKSALLTRKARGVKHGLDHASAREPQASRFYDQTHHIGKDQHAVMRVRQLFAGSLGYDIQSMSLNYGLEVEANADIKNPTVVFLHGTTWPSKQWPLEFWQDLLHEAEASGKQVLLPAGNEVEREFCMGIAEASACANVLPAMDLSELAATLKAVQGVVSVDSGLAHLAAALDVPSVSLYGATSSKRTGTLGKAQNSLQAGIDCSPCYKRQCPLLTENLASPPCTQSWSADFVWNELQLAMIESE